MVNKEKKYLEIDFEKNFTEEEINLIIDICYKINKSSAMDDFSKLVKSDKKAKIVYFHFIFLFSKFIASSIISCNETKFIESLCEELLKKDFCEDLVDRILFNNATFEIVE